MCPGGIAEEYSLFIEINETRDRYGLSWKPRGFGVLRAKTYTGGFELLRQNERRNRSILSKCLL